MAVQPEDAAGRHRQRLAVLTEHSIRPLPPMIDTDAREMDG
jgi:hypothetical protein